MGEESTKQNPPQTLSASYIALASASASLVTKSLLHPLDTVKCRLQSSSARNLKQIWRSYRGRWGPRYLYSGLPIKLLFYMPYQSIYMTSYSTVKESLLSSRSTGEESRWDFLGRTILAATAAELSSCVVRVPMETIKMRVQSLVVMNTVEALKQIRQHGFYASARLVLPQTFLHDIPFSAIQWILYETFSSWTRQTLQNSRMSDGSADSGTVMWHYMQCFGRAFLSGGFSGCIASILTIPLDTLRTRVVVTTSADPSATIFSAARDAYCLGGVKIFFRGANTRLLWVTTNMALYFPVFEISKMFLLNVQSRSEERCII